MEKEIYGVRGAIPFPCHTKEKVLVYSDADGHCSIKCPLCASFAMFDFKGMLSTPAPPARGMMRRINSEKQNTYID